MKKLIEGSIAVAEAVNLCKPAVIAAYPITPQTHIVEQLAKIKADGRGDFEFVRSESEFAAASIVLGAAATGSRAYTATSSQGLLLMTEVVFTISGMRLPIVLTCANRAISAPINIWNDQQDVMTVRDAGWIQLFAENNQEAADFHYLGFKVAEELRIPVMINMDGFVLTHTFEPVDIPTQKEVNKYLPAYEPEEGQFLDVDRPVSLGTFATPEHYQEIRLELQSDLMNSAVTLKNEFKIFHKQFKRGPENLVEYSGDKKAEVVFVAMGSVLGTIKDAAEELRAAGKRVGVLKISCFRPFPAREITKALASAGAVAVIDKSISLGNEGILATEVKAALQTYGGKAKVKGFVIGLGGRDITREDLKLIYRKAKGVFLVPKTLSNVLIRPSRHTADLASPKPSS